MGNVNNEELVKKAAIVADDLATGGLLNPAQSDKFIDYVIDQTVLPNNARTVRFRNQSLVIDKIGVGRRVAVPKTEASDPNVRRGISTSKITLTPVEIMVPFEIGDNFRELNIEGDAVEDTVIRMMATQLANDIEDLYINGNKLGPAVTESEYNNDEGGSTTKYVKDRFMALQDGWSLLAEAGNIVDADGSNVGLSVFSSMIRAMPTKFRRNMKALRWFLSPDLWQLYLEKLSTRATALGDDAVGGGGGTPGPFGIPAVPIPLWAFQPKIVEHLVLTGSTPGALSNKNVSNVTVLPGALNAVATTPFIPVTDYTLDAANGTITRNGSGITSGATVKVTYDAPPQILLTHQNNMIVGIGRDIRIEKDRDIYKSVNQYAITAKVSVQYEEVTAIVKAKNLGLNV